MENKVKKTGIKILKIFGITVVSVLFLMFILPLLFPTKITNEVKKFANEKLEGELNFKEANLSFFNHFPSLTLQLTDFSLNGSAPYKNESLIKAKEIAFGINLSDLIFKSSVSIDKIFLSNAQINVKVNEKGEANYNVYIADTTKVAADSGEASLHLESIIVTNSHLFYNDQSLKMLVDAKGFNYSGHGNLDKAIFDLQSKAKIDAIDFTFGGEPYLQNKKVEAELITKINTNSLSFVFQQNDLKINTLPVKFTGKLDFLKNGYDLDFQINSTNSNLFDVFSALPPQYIKWLKKTKVEGKSDLSLALKGQYIAATNINPDLAFNFKIRNGVINYDNSTLPVSNLFLNFDAKLPSLDVEKLQVNLDSIFLNVGKDYFKAIVKSTGLSNPKIDANIQASMDLQKMNRAFGFPNLEIRGILNGAIIAKGEYNKTQNLYPVTKGNIDLKNGYLKTEYYPNPIENITLIAKILNEKGTAKDMNIDINQSSFLFEGKPFTVKASFQNLEDVAYDVKAKGELDVAKIYKVFSQKGLDLDGFIKMDVAFQGKQSDATNGNYNQLKNSGNLELRNIKVISAYFPKPFVINEGIFTFNEDKMNFNNFTATYGSSDFAMNGNLQNVINFVLSDKEILKGDFSFNSNYINVDEFMSKITTSKDTINVETVEVKKQKSGVIIIPKNLDLNLMANANKVNFDDLILSKLKGNLVINKGKLSLKNSSFSLIGCIVKSNISYADETSKLARFDMSIMADDFDVKKAYNEVKMFRTMASAAENAEGIISLNYNVKGKLNEDMMPIYPSLSGSGTLSVKDVKMKGFKMFNAVSKKTSSDGFKNPDITKVDIKSTIKNNIITLEQFKFKFAGFRPRIEGTTSFDGKLNVKMRLGLPPLGIIGIPLTITGTQENPLVKVGKKGEEIEEIEYIENQEIAK